MSVPKCQEMDKQNFRNVVKLSEFEYFGLFVQSKYGTRHPRISIFSLIIDKKERNYVCEITIEDLIRSLIQREIN